MTAIDYQFSDRITKNFPLCAKMIILKITLTEHSLAVCFQDQLILQLREDLETCLWSKPNQIRSGQIKPNACSLNKSE